MQWNNLHRPCGLYRRYPPPGLLSASSVRRWGQLKSPNLGPRVSIVDHEGKLLSRFGDPHASLGPTGFIGPHGMCADSSGDLYVGEVSWTLWPGAFPGEPRPESPRCFRKFKKVH